MSSHPALSGEGDPNLRVYGYAGQSYTDTLTGNVWARAEQSPPGTTGWTIIDDGDAGEDKKYMPRDGSGQSPSQNSEFVQNVLTQEITPDTIKPGNEAGFQQVFNVPSVPDLDFWRLDIQEPNLSQPYFPQDTGVQSVNRVGNSATTLSTDLDIDAGGRRNLWRYTENSENTTYYTTLASATRPGETIEMGGITLSNLRVTTFNGGLESRLNVAFAPFRETGWHICSFYAYNRSDLETFFLPRNISNNSAYGHGMKRIDRQLRRYWFPVYATASNQYDPIFNPTVAPGSGTLSNNLCWVKGANTSTLAVPLDMMIGGFQIEKAKTDKWGVAVMGDSLFAQTAAQIDRVVNPRYATAYAAAGLNCWFFNRAEGGETTAEMDARWGTAITPLSHLCKYAIIWGGRNDISQGRALADIQGSITSMIGKAVSEGMIPVVCTVTPNSGDYDDPVREGKRNDLNEWIRTTFDHVIDMAMVATDPENRNRLRPSLYNDGTHWTAIVEGARLCARAIVDSGIFEFEEPSPYQSIPEAIFPANRGSVSVGGVDLSLPQPIIRDHIESVGIGGRSLLGMWGSKGDVTESPFTWAGYVQIPSTNPTSNSYMFGWSPNSILQTGSSNSLMATLTADSPSKLLIRQTGDTNMDQRNFEWAGFAQSYAGKTIFLSITFPANDTSRPVVIVNGMDISYNFSVSTSGTPPNWMDPTLDTTYYVCGRNWPAGIAVPFGWPINREWTIEDHVEWMRRGTLSIPDAAGGSPIGKTSGTLVVGYRYRITEYQAGDDFTNAGASENADGEEFIATQTTPTVWSNGSTLIRVGALMSPIIQPIMVVDDATENGNQLRIVGHYPITQKKDWRIIARTNTNGSVQLLGGQVFQEADTNRIDAISIRNLGSDPRIVSLGNAASETQYVNSGTATVSPVLSDFDPDSRFNIGTSIYLTADGTDELVTTISGHLVG